MLTGARPKILLYGDVDLNILDGSAVWLVSMAEVLSRAGADTTVVLKAPIVKDRLAKQLEVLPGVTVVEREPGEPEPLTPRRAAQVIAREFSHRSPNVVIARGLKICAAIANNEEMSHRLWAYITDIPRGADGRDSEALKQVRSVAARAQMLFAQTEDARAYLESIAPESAGKTLLLPPMIPDAQPQSREPSTALRAVYAGKMARAWRTLEMLELPAKLEAAHGVAMRLSFIGDKVQDDRSDTLWAAKMRRALGETHADDRIQLLGGLSREESVSHIGKNDVGISWRDSSLDSSLELSTKALEYAISGVAPIINDTAAHRRLLGEDYPFFVRDEQDVLRALARAAREADTLHEAQRRARDAAEPYTMAAAAARLRQYLGRYAVPSVDAERIKVVVAGHDFKFAADIFDALAHGPFEVRVDKWETLHKNDSARSEELLAWADVVFCEWAGPNAVWYSQRVRPEQRLFVRFHGFEVRGPWIGNIDRRKVDSVFFVSDFYRVQIVETLGWYDVKTITVPNSVDALDLDRPKAPGAEFHLGIMGVVPMLKRPDRAVALLERLLERDDRYVLHVRGRAPWDYAWEWRKAEQRDAYEQLFEKILQTDLRHSVIFEDFGPDVGNWFRRIGWILSPSTRETFHLAPLEGMASGAVPVFWPRDGVREIYGHRWSIADANEAADRILAVNQSGTWRAEGADAKKYALEFDLEAARARWHEELGA